MKQDDIEITNSNGRTSGGLKIVKFIRPKADCFNRSRRITGYTPAEIIRKTENIISKWYAPRIILYEIDGHIIGSNSKQNALYEYWRVCDMKDLGKEFEVKTITI